MAGNVDLVPGGNFGRSIGSPFITIPSEKWTFGVASVREEPTTPISCVIKIMRPGF